MSLLSKCIKKSLQLSSISVAIGLLTFQTAFADPNDNCQSVLKSAPAPVTVTDSYLKAIAWFTCYTEQYTYNAAISVSSWLNDADTSDNTAILQQLFTNYVSAADNEMPQITALQPQILGDLITPNMQALPYVNDFTYQTLLGQAPTPLIANVDADYNYIKNAAGLSIHHQTPPLKLSDWQGKDYYKTQYINLYKTLLSVETFNAYALSELYVDAKSNNPLVKQRQALLDQASTPNWFKQIASENTNNVLRQILMYNSQTFVLLTQILQTQQQMLQAQVMSNTLVMANSQLTESDLLQKARSKTGV